MRLLSAVVVNYRSAALAAACVDSLRREAAAAGVPLEVVVVDNSPALAERALLEGLEGVRYVPLEENAGYAGGLARGVAEAEGDVLLLANPDLLFRAGSLPPLLDSLGRPNVGAAGPRFYWDEEERWLLPPLWRPTPAAEVLKILARSRAGFRDPLRRAWQALALPQWRADGPLAVPGLVGALVAVPRGVWDRVGPWDRRYPLFFEDTDWAVRLAREGLSSLLVPGSRVVHLHGRSTGAASESALASYLASESLYFARHFGAAARALRATAGRLLPPAPLGGLPDGRPPVRLSWRRPCRALVELTTVAEGAPSAGRFVDGSSFELEGADWERLPPGPAFLRVTDLAGGRVVAEAAFRKPAVSPGPGYGRG